MTDKSTLMLKFRVPISGLRKKAFLVNSFGILVILICFNSIWCQAQIQTISLKPGPIAGNDAVIIDNNPNTPYGANQDFIANAWTAAGGSFIQRSMICFDLNAIPASAVILDAELNLFSNPTTGHYQHHSSLSGPNICLLQKITTPWNENSVTWNNQPTTSTIDQVTLPQSVSTMQNYLNIDVTALVTDQFINPLSNFGFLFRLVTESQYRCMSFSSSDNSDPALWPELVVTYQLCPEAISTFLAPDTSCAGVPVNFSNTSSNASTYLWSFGDDTSSIAVNPTHIYPNPGTYTITLTAVNDCDTSTTTQQIIIPPYIQNILGNDTVLCSENPFPIYATPGMSSYNWSTADTGSFISVSSAGNYCVTVTSTEGCTGNDCINITITQVVVPVNIAICPGDSLFVGGDFQHLPGIYYDTVHQTSSCDSIYIITLSLLNVVKPNLGSDTVLCFDQAYTINAGMGYSSYLWNTLATSQSIIAALPGTYWVMATDINGCHAYDSIQLSVLPPVSLNLGVDTIVCMGVAVNLDAGTGFNNYQWNTGATSQVLTVSQSGIYSVTVSVDGNCKGSDTITVLFQPGNVTNLPPDAGFCEGNTITLTVMNPGVAYAWNTGATSPSIMVSVAGLYIVSVTDIMGCQSPDSTVVSMFPQLVLSVTPPEAFICRDSSIVLDATGAVSYAWFPVSGLSSGTGATVTAAPGITTTYMVSGTAPGSCPGDTTVTIEVIESPVSTLPDSSLVCEGNTLELDPGSCFTCSYLWSTGSTFPVIDITDPGSYWVIINNGACKVKDEIIVGECFEIWIPNVFTPNGDGKNDVFLPRGIHIKEFRMLIYNRWGEQLFESHDFQAGWDGTYHGKQCSAGVYVYLIDYQGWGSAYTYVKGQRHGALTLFR